MRAAFYALSLTLGLALVASLAGGQPAPAARTAVVVEIKDAIGPATKDHFLRALAKAEEQRAELLVLVLDTPGGLDAAMRDMIGWALTDITCTGDTDVLAPALHGTWDLPLHTLTWTRART